MIISLLIGYITALLPIWDWNTRPEGIKRKNSTPRHAIAKKFRSPTTTYAPRFIIYSQISILKLKGRREKARPTPSKTVSIIRSEGKSHRTKRELRQREQAEKAVLTGIPLKERLEVRENETAHKEFLRLKKLLEKIDKFDDMYGAVINRYCILYAETKEFEEKKERFYRQLCDLEENKEELLETEQMTYGEYYKTETSMQKNLIALDRQVQAKRRMLSDIEKENIMTIASSLRSVPKTEAKKSNPLKEALGG